jgi:hypothetical protein
MQAGCGDKQKLPSLNYDEKELLVTIDYLVLAFSNYHFSFYGPTYLATLAYSVSMCLVMQMPYREVTYKTVDVDGGLFRVGNY